MTSLFLYSHHSVAIRILIDFIFLYFVLAETKEFYSVIDLVLRKQVNLLSFPNSIEATQADEADAEL